jgi:mono/diheme cytochrome c family protein
MCPIRQGAGGGYLEYNGDMGMRMLAIRFAALVVLVASVAGCDLVSGSNNVLSAKRSAFLDPVGSPRFEAVRSILSTSCVSCHSNFPGYSEASWIALGYVVPGSAMTSPLYMKLRGSNTGGAENMPSGAPALPADQLLAIRSWIDLLGGDAAPPPPPPAGATTAAQRTSAALQLISAKCSSCHNVSRVATSVDFNSVTVPPFATYTSDNAFAVSGLVTPANAGSSWLFRSLENFGDINTMPQSQPLSPSEALILSDWINGMGSP